MTDWRLGYGARWEVALVDAGTWADSGSLGSARSVSVARSSDEPLLETGTMELDGDSGFSSAWCRIYMVAEQGGSEKVPMATLLFEKQAARTDRGAATVSARGRSVLQPAADRRMGRGSFVPASADGAAYAAGLLRECTPAPVEVEGSFTLVDDYVFDIGTDYLSAAWQLLGAAGWCMQVDGLGAVRIRPLPSEPDLELSRDNAALLVPGVGDDFSLVDVPNRYMALYDGEVYVAENDDPSSPASRASRGRWVDFVDGSPTLVDGEHPGLYARRKLAEASTVLRKFSYSREHWPGVTPFSMVRASLPDAGIEGDLRVISQSLRCGRGVLLDEVSGLEERL